MPIPELHTAPALSRLCGIFYHQFNVITKSSLEFVINTISSNEQQVRKQEEQVMGEELREQKPPGNILPLEPDTVNSANNKQVVKTKTDFNIKGGV